MDLHLQCNLCQLSNFIILKESFESDITYINYQIFTKSEREWAYDMLHMLDKLELKEVAMFSGSYI